MGVELRSSGTAEARFFTTHTGQFLCQFFPSTLRAMEWGDQSQALGLLSRQPHPYSLSFFVCLVLVELGFIVVVVVRPSLKKVQVRMAAVQGHLGWPGVEENFTSSH